MERVLKIIMSGGMAILCGLIAYGNIHDPSQNLAFVQHVLSMDTVAAGSAMTDHALSIPLIWLIAFWTIVVGEDTDRHPLRVRNGGAFVGAECLHE
jgi:predicted small integral membrane protein